MDLLKLGNEMIRNEALLLLIEISKTNVELQKVIAFENGFENLLSIIESEGYANGGIVVQDCLTLINNLLSGNTSNQNHFREMNCIKRLPDLLKIEQSDLWSLSDDKKEILLLALNVVCSLLSSPSSIPITLNMINGGAAALPSSSIQATQLQLGVNRVHARVIELGLSTIKTPAVRIKALWALGDLIFSHNDNRTYLEQNDFKAPTSNGRISAILKVTQVLFSSKVPMEALAALHVLKCYFYGNVGGQRIIAATISTTATTPNPLDEAYPGRIIIRHLLGWETHKDVGKTFYAALSLCYVLYGNTSIKEQLLKLPTDAPPANSSIAPGTTPTPTETLFSKIVKSFVRSCQLQSELPIIVGFLRLISTWIEDVPTAAAQFRQNPTALSAMSDLIRSQPGELHLAGLAAYLYALVVDGPTLSSDAAVAAAQPLVAGRLQSLRASAEFIQAEKGGSRLKDEESKMPFFDTSFVHSLLKLLARLLPSAVTLPDSTTRSNPSTQNTHTSSSNRAVSPNHTSSSMPSQSIHLPSQLPPQSIAPVSTAHQPIRVVPTPVSATELFGPTPASTTSTSLSSHPTQAASSHPQPQHPPGHSHSQHHNNNHSNGTQLSLPNGVHNPPYFSQFNERFEFRV